ncbi:2-oxoacid:acceptor oxidoreductase subunit delta [Spirochaetia bacterium]|nr:2-oxoacid:acceptor oxidoreductase subunit delta [Spirochaetia bacterium]
MRYRVTIDEERCKGCELCAAFCGKKLIEPARDRLNKAGLHPMFIRDQDACVGCLSCGLMCPDAVITIEKLDVIN